jgi:hypothetical protein
MASDTLRRQIHVRLERQQMLVRWLLERREQLQGSLFARYQVCGKESCACRQGRKHGPYWVLSNRSGGQGSFAYLERDQARRARELVRQHRQFREGVRRLQKLNLEIVDLLRRYQADASRRAGDQMGLSLSR